MEEAEAWTMFCVIRWPETDGDPICPHCACPTCWSCPRPNGAPRFRCTACRRDFSPTSGTLFAFHKLPIRDYLAAVVIFCDEVKGQAALARSRDLAGLFSSNKRLIMQEFSYSFRKRLRLCIKGVPFVSRPDHLDTYRGSTLPRSIPQTHTAHSRNILK
jgi:hypothetical protein